MLTIKQIDYLKKRLEIFNQAERLYKIEAGKSFFAPYFYEKEVTDYIQWMHAEKLIQPDCYEINDDFKANYKNDQWYKSLSQKQVIQCLAIIIRLEKFNDGLVANHIKDGTFGKLITQLENLVIKK